jgi:hypothetical protein
VVTAILAGLLVVALAVIVLLALRVERLAEIADADHGGCVDQITQAVGRRVIGDAVRTLAVRWDSVEEQQQITMLGRDYTVGGRSVPAMWMFAQAARIEEGE